MKHLSGCFTLILVLLTMQGQSQNFSTARLDELAGQFVKKMHENNIEKIWLQTDRNLYAAGENIWFSVYLLNCITNRHDTLSKNLFVDFVSDKDSVINRIVLNTATLHAAGAIKLPDTLATGMYWLRSYTKTILTQNRAGMYIQPIYVKNVSAGGNYGLLRNTYTGRGPLVNYFPEGGFFVTNVNSTGVIQVTDSAGSALIAEGKIVNKRDSVLAHFTTNKFGLAKVKFYPLPNEEYYAMVNTPEGPAKCPLPFYNPYMAQLAITGRNNGVVHARIILEDAIDVPGYITYIMGINRDSVCFTGMGKGIYNLEIPESNFPGGIVTLLLFDAQYKLLSERKLFIDHDNYKLNVKTNKINYGRREEADLSISVENSEGRPMGASLSISVQDDRVMQLSNEMAFNLMPPTDAYRLGEWIKENRENITDDDIDLLLMARPPDYINWQNLEMNHLEYRDSSALLLNLSGHVVNRRGLPVKGRVITGVAVKSVNPYFGIDTTNAEGDFHLPLPPGSDSLVFAIRLTTMHDIKTGDSLVVNNFNFPSPLTPVAFKKYFYTDYAKVASDFKRYHLDTFFTATGKEWLKPVTVTSIVKKQVDYDESKRMSPFSFILSGDKLGHGAPDEIYNNLLMVPGVSELNGVLTIYGMGSFSGGAEPIVVVDGMVQSKPLREILGQMSFRMIDFIEVLRGADAGIFGVRGGNGAIVINTRTKARELSSNEGSQFKVVRPVTYHTAPRFNMPDYTNPSTRNGKSPDPRTTIYWNANIVTDKYGIASVNFFTADDATTYTVTITGLTANGEYVYKRITVNRK
ncbi:MAG TPA: Plug domain-containing protein [Chitinophagaceae bacterium]|nr:Plug domain-containing protein [Chitinophagaceae bacterium]